MKPADGPDEKTAARSLPTASSTATASSDPIAELPLASATGTVGETHPPPIEHDHPTPCRQAGQERRREDVLVQRLHRHQHLVHDQDVARTGAEDLEGDVSVTRSHVLRLARRGSAPSTVPGAGHPAVSTPRSQPSRQTPHGSRPNPGAALVGAGRSFGDASPHLRRHPPHWFAVVEPNTSDLLLGRPAELSRHHERLTVSVVRCGERRS